jgi:hypothetical protein
MIRHVEDGTHNFFFGWMNGTIFDTTHFVTSEREPRYTETARGIHRSKSRELKEQQRERRAKGVRGRRRKREKVIRGDGRAAEGQWYVRWEHSLETLLMKRARQ